MSTRRNYKNYFGSRGGCAKVTSIPIRTRHRIKRRWSAVDGVGLNNNTQPNQQCDNTVGKSNEDLDDNLHPSLPQLDMNDDAEVSESGLSTSSDDDDDEDDYDKNEHHNKQYKIFPGAKLTTTESCMLVIGFAIRHKLSKSAMTDLLTLINFHLPTGVSIPSLMFLLNKMLGPDYTLAKKIPFCEKCQCIIENSNNCIKCGQVNMHKAIKDGNYFVSFDIGSVLKSLLEKEAISKSIIKNFVKRANNLNASNVISDIIDGSDYKKLKLKKYDLTCCLNTDGVSIFNSSGFSVWPLLLSINELDYPLRRKHTILGGLWLGQGKPNFTLFLNPFMKQAAQLSTEGIVWTANNKMMTSKIFFPLFAADSVARCQIQGINQFNGEYSCPWCLAKGKNFKISDSRHKWIFDPTETSIKRDKEIFVQHLLQLRDKLQHGSIVASHFGIKLASPLINLKNFDIVGGFVFDYMHTVLLGVVRTFAFAWTESKNHSEPFYIGTKAQEINQRIAKCKIPHECSRSMREIKEMKYWKASEWKTWMVIAIPLLRGILPNCYLKHFAKLIVSISTLSQDTVTLDKINEAEKLVKEFCLLTPNLYDKSYCSFNIHLLTHAADCVRRWGPLWSYSLFQFENYNGVLTNSYCGTREGSCASFCRIRHTIFIRVEPAHSAKNDPSVIKTPNSELYLHLGIASLLDLNFRTIKNGMVQYVHEFRACSNRGLEAASSAVN
ncbi:hypothetical protein Fcan01_17480 [Folsomia candida]|uniref:Transposase domain-containing protein n=1 Tax=Folsomia candida TaxID=158441 RepID=A0A226DT75_FOLCA|nr:hypothetical protein Fcan01_17480 [Folsomia candida]